MIKPAYEQVLQSKRGVWHIRGNDLARATDDIDFSPLCQEVRQHYQDNKNAFPKIYHYLLDLAHARMVKLDDLKKTPALHDPGGPLSASKADVFQTQINKLQTWQLGPSDAEPHPVVGPSVAQGALF